MTEFTREGKEANKMLVLGFDAGCGTCAEIAGRVEERVGDRLVVRNLGDPELMGWREEALGKNAPWAPTLFEVEGGKVRAWTGKRMALPLSRKLGAVRTWRVMEALGEVAAVSSVESTSAAGKLPVKAAEAVAGMSRGQFLKGVGGAAVAMSVLSGAGSLASPAQATTRSPYDVVKSRRVTGAQLQSTARRIGMSPDVRNLVGQALSTPAKVSAAKPAAWLNTLRNGTAQRVVVYQISGDRTVSYVEFTKPPKHKAATRAMLFQTGGERLTIVKASEGGMLWRRANDAESAQRTIAGAGSTPLGECPPISSRPPRSNTVCGWTRVTVCADWTFSATCGFSGVVAVSSCAACVVAVYATYRTAGEAAKSIGPACGTCVGSVGLAATSCCARTCQVWVPASCGS